MKEQIEQLLESYERRIETASRMILENDNSKDYNKDLDRRLVIKRAGFRTIVFELTKILNHEQRSST